MKSNKVARLYWTMFSLILAVWVAVAITPSTIWETLPSGSTDSYLLGLRYFVVLGFIAMALIHAQAAKDDGPHAGFFVLVAFWVFIYPRPLIGWMPEVVSLLVIGSFLPLYAKVRSWYFARSYRAHRMRRLSWITELDAARPPRQVQR